LKLFDVKAFSAFTDLLKSATVVRISKEPIQRGQSW